MVCNVVYRKSCVIVVARSVPRTTKMVIAVLEIWQSQHILLNFFSSAYNRLHCLTITRVCLLLTPRHVISSHAKCCLQKHENDSVTIVTSSRLFWIYCYNQLQTIVFLSMFCPQGLTPEQALHTSTLMDREARKRCRQPVRGRASTWGATILYTSPPAARCWLLNSAG